MYCSADFAFNSSGRQMSFNEHALHAFRGFTRGVCPLERNQVSSIDARPGWYHGEGAPHAVEERHRIFVDAYGRSPQGAWIEIYWSLSARSRNARVSGRIQDRTHGLLTRRCHQRSHRPASTPDEPNTGPYHAERSNPLRRSFPTRPSIPPPPTSTVRDAAAIH